MCSKDNIDSKKTELKTLVYEWKHPITAKILWQNITEFFKYRWQKRQVGRSDCSTRSSRAAN